MPMTQLPRDHTMLEIENLCRQFKGRRVLRDITLSLKAG